MKALGRIGLVGTAAAAAVFASCAPPTEAERIAGFLKETTALAEKRDGGAVVSRLSDGYRDFEGRDKAGAAALIEEYLGRYRGIVIHLLSAAVEEADADGLVPVRAEIMLSSGAAESLRRLIRYSGEYYRLGLRLRRSGGRAWLIEYAEWEPVSVTELLPESLKFLKKLFPDL